MGDADGVRITVLVENTAGGVGLLGQHGLSFLVQMPEGFNVLFDTGQAKSTLRTNCRILGVNVEEIDVIVLSHGHYDHTTGLKYALSAAPNAPVVMHPAALDSKFSLRDGERPRYVGIPERVRDRLYEGGRKLNLVDAPMEVVPGAYFLGEVERRTPFEKPDDRYFLDPEGAESDVLPDDSAMVIRTGEGLVVLMGCAHSGLVNTTEHVSRLWKGQKIAAIIGGAHLVEADEARLEGTVDCLLAAAPRTVALGHCTGFRAMVMMAYAFGERFVPLQVGRRFGFPA